jgi:hypothetical protein
METTSSHKEAATMKSITKTTFIKELVAETQILADETGDTFVVAEDKATGYVGVTSIDNIFTNSNGNQYDLWIIATVDPSTEVK